PRSGRVVRPSDQLISLEGWWRCLADLGGSLADKASRLFEQLKATALGLGSIEMCAGHGMYTCSQVLLLEGRTVTVDWDSFNVADPSHDVARMQKNLTAGIHARSEEHTSELQSPDHLVC